MPSRRIALLLAFAAILSACQSITPEQRHAADEAKCSGYGFRKGTEAFANCMMRIDLERRLERALWSRPYYGPGPYYWY